MAASIKQMVVLKLLNMPEVDNNGETCAAQFTNGFKE
jgi:hypothetical protein